MDATETTIEPGAVLRVFDPKLWGHKDVGDNSQFWQNATVVASYVEGGESLIDVRFHHDGRLSHGHFADPLSVKR